MASCGTTPDLETWTFPASQTARYVRIVGYGNSSNNWNSITEVEVHGLSAVFLEAVADAYVQSGSNAGTNFGSSVQLRVKDAVDPEYNRETFLRFDVSSVGGPIAEAVVLLKIAGADTGGASTSYAAYLVDAGGENWAENAITWNTRPSVGATALATWTTTSSSTEVPITITDVAEAARQGDGIVSICIRSLTEGDSDWVIYHSRESSTDIGPR